MNRKAIIFVFLFLVPLLNFAQINQVMKVKYLSSEYVYIDAGRAEGVTIGDQYEVVRDQLVVAMVEVAYVADHSASCKILSSENNIQAGDLLKLLRKGTGEEKSAEIESKETLHLSEVTTKDEKEQKPKSMTRISGNMAIQWYHFEDLTESNLNFSQPTLRFNFKAKKIWNREYNLRIRFRSRRDERSRRYSNDVPESEWRNRIYEASFSYDDLNKPLNFKAGRIISNTFSGIGYIDGLLLQHNAGDLWRWGVFAGTQPEWQYSDFQTSIQKYGGYFNLLKGDYTTNRLESTLAMAGEYHGSTISREFLYLQNSYTYGSRMSIYQSLELDYNRAWRKNKTAETLSLTGLYLSASYDVTDWLNTGISYDNRKNYYTYELRSLADSLFDSAFRHGVRANLNISYFKTIRLYGNFGWRKRENESSNTYSYAAGVNFSNLMIHRLRLSARFAGFTNYYTRGYNPSIYLTQSFRQGHLIGIAYGTYIYSIKQNSKSNLNNWLRLNGQLELPLNLYISANYEYDWGDDLKGHRFLAELGYRF